MSDSQTRPAGPGSAALGFDRDSDTPWPWDALGGMPPGTADPFSMLRPAAGEHTAQAAAPDRTDVIELLKREAEAALRDPDYVSAYLEAGTGAASDVPAAVARNPLQMRSREGNHAGSLMDMLATAGHTNTLIGSQQAEDDHQFFAIPPAPDVLWLFAGDIVPARRRDVAAPLTRREHHLVSMDSAYRPAQTQTPEPDHDA
ncbi:TagK domain-containing protein [Cupriavidus basilensis]|uniref:TagK domain-containing protein n=1 Tax=Cupriavidus basilensis TaxID=68895 RepID=UPI00157A88B3|nr:TagK domain-containing protein [Cupriavidus basilensis]NUA32254.1 TagK domain-containing protein [Cupriavidus basilensis]